jgi:prepilin-type N-terminal cleavage/methylation domain-containing protein
VHRQRGFTLIELLIVVVIIGILAAIAIPKFANTKQKAYVAQMKSDLRNLATAQEAFFYDSSYYTTSIPSLGGFAASSSVTLAVNEATAGGWSATATHAQVGRECYLYSGTAAPVGNATVDGKITCS